MNASPLSSPALLPHRPRRRPEAAALLIGLALCAGAAQAGRPLITEDAGVLARADCEWEGFLARSQDDGLRSRDWSTQVGCGIGGRSQLALAYGESRTAGLRVRAVGLGGKTGLFTSADEATSVTLAWGGAQARAAGERAESIYLNGVLTQRLGTGLQGHVNLGRSQDRGDGPYRYATQWGLALEWTALPGLDLMAELVGERHADRMAGVGLRWALNDAWSVNGSWHRRQGDPAAHMSTLGAKFTF